MRTYVMSMLLTTMAVGCSDSPASRPSGDSEPAGDADSGGDSGTQVCQALVNGNFEEQAEPGAQTPPGFGLVFPGGETVIGVDGDWALDTELYVDGGHSLRIHPEKDKTFILYQMFYLYDPAAAGNTEIAASVHLRHRGLRGNDKVGVMIMAYDADDGASLGALEIAAHADAEVWQEYTDVLSVASSAVQLHVLLVAMGNAADEADAAAWLDVLILDVDPCVEARQCPWVDPATTVISREDSIPDSVVKFDPIDDPAPPVLQEAFRYDPTNNPDGDGEWYDPEPLDGPINTAGSEDSVFIANDDDNTVYFYFTPSMMLDAGVQALMPEEGIYSVTRTKSGDDWVWNTPQKMWLFDTVAGEGCEFVSGDEIWFCGIACGMANGQKSQFYASRQAGVWALADLAPDPFNDPDYAIGELHMTVDENSVQWLYFHSSRPGGQGQVDLWVSRHEGGVWSAPINLGPPVNSAVDEGYPYLTSDGLELWFSGGSRDSGYLGYGAIFRSVRQGWDAANQVWLWGEPDEIITRYAGESTMDSDRNIYFTHHFFDIGEGALVEADIYVARHK